MRELITVDTERRRGRIRPLDPFHDLESVVELIDLGFGDRLDPVARATLARMRRFAQGGLFRQWVLAFRGKVGVALGLVWVEDGTIVGNVSLRRARSRGGYLIGNVVVHPDWRNQGIGTALMKAAIRGISERGGRWVGLEVRTDNATARHIYERLRFHEVGTTLHLLRPPGAPRRREPVSDGVRRPSGADAEDLVELMHAVIPEEQRPLLEVEESEYRPGYGRTVRHWLGGEPERWWVVESEQGIAGAVRVARKGGSFPNRLEILVRPGEGGVEAVLVNRGLKSLPRSSKKSVAVRLPAATHSVIAALESEGFEARHELVQMKRTLRHRITVSQGDRCWLRAGNEEDGPPRSHVGLVRVSLAVLQLGSL